MSKTIPIYFDNAVIMSPAQPVSGSNKNLSRLKVGAFTKYGNRNGSYITDQIADQLIASATRGDTPVVGFFDAESKDWAGHTGPTLASAYGYVESFEGWQPFQDKDGITRDYAVFNTVLFTRYYDQANYVVGSNQSMELDINSIQGDWADIDGTEYFVYTAAEMLGFCIIGSHEPCFSVSAFFSKKDEEYATQYEKFSSLLADLKAQVEEADRNPKGGEVIMENPELNPEVNFEQDPAPAVEPTPAADPVEPEVEPASEAEAEVELEVQPAEEEVDPTPAPTPDFEAQIAELQNQINELTTNYENAQARITELEGQITSASETEAALRAEIATYEAERTRLEVEQKNAIVDKYATRLTDEEIAPVRDSIETLTIDEVESKLAITFANKQMAGSDDQNVVPLPEPVVDQFALLMEKYRKN